MFNKKEKRFFIYILFSLSVISFAFFMPSYSIAQDALRDDAAATEITDIAVEGNKVVSTNTILSKIKVRVGTRFIQRTVNEDIKRLYATGFFTDVIAEAEDYRSGIRLIFKVTEKSVVGSVVFQGNKIYRAELLKKQITTKEGDVLNKRVLAEDAKKLESFYRKKGFALVKVEYSYETDQETNASVVHIMIDEKKQYKIKSIIFTGNEKFSANRLLKIISTRTDGFFRSGVLDENLVKQDMERLEAFYKDGQQDKIWLF